MNEKRLKHLEFIQNIITRMNTNSFQIKGWSVTLISALFALAADKANVWFTLLAYFPVLVFWGLDGFFLSQEKQYRGLYRDVALKDESVIDFNLDASGYSKHPDKTWWAATCSPTLRWFHGSLFIVLSLVIACLIAGSVLHFMFGCCHGE